MLFNRIFVFTLQNVVEHCKVSPLEIIDARGALHAYYHWPKTLAQHLAAKLLLSWAWIYLVRFNFWYIIINDDDAPTKVRNILNANFQ